VAEESGFGEVFIKGHAAARGASAGVRHAHAIQDVLQLAVFTKGAVNHIENQIGARRKLEPGAGDVHRHGIEAVAGQSLEHGAAGG